MGQLNFILTSDGSKTLFNPEVGEHYHSRHGALQESRHVFLNSGLKYFLEGKEEKKARILEVGFGTGLNFLLSANYCSSNEIYLDYTGIEAYPLSLEMIGDTAYHQYLSEELWQTFLENYKMLLRHEVDEVELNPYSKLSIACTKLQTFETEKYFDIIYFDAFAAARQPEMWTHESLAHVCQYLESGGVFVTYAITGNLKRSMKALGFSIEKAIGAPGKREMLRAVKL